MPIYDLPNTPPTMQCLHEEAARQRLPPDLLLAVMRTEGGRMGQFQRNTNASYDIGPLQINTYWLKTLAKKAKTTPRHVALQLAYNGCWNVAVGAWILRQAINETPGDPWRGVGYYNSHNIKYWPAYSRRVQGHYRKILASAGPRKLPANLARSESRQYAARSIPVAQGTPMAAPFQALPVDQSRNYARFAPVAVPGLPPPQLASD